MKLQKWNYDTRKYEDYEVPDEWYVPIIAELYDMVNCASCGKLIKYGNSFTSLEIHENKVGSLGYAVCDTCFNQEWERKIKNNNKDTMKYSKYNKYNKYPQNKKKRK